MTVDESYWTDGYSLQKLARRTKNKTTQGENSLPTSVVPPFLQDVMEDVYVCGKSINLLRLIAPEVSSLSQNLYSSLISSVTSLLLFVDDFEVAVLGGDTLY